MADSRPSPFGQPFLRQHMERLWGGALQYPSCKHVHVHVTVMRVASGTSLCHGIMFNPLAFVLVKAGIACDVRLHVPEVLPFLVHLHATAYASRCERTAAGTGCGHLCPASRLNVSSCVRDAVLLCERMLLRE